MSEVSLREMCVLVRDAIGGDARVTKSATGPRSNEVWFTTADGRHVTVAVHVQEKI